MRSQTKWSILFITVGIMIILLSRFHIAGLIYGAGFLIIGLVLIIFRKREEIIEGALDEV